MILSPRIYLWTLLVSYLVQSLSIRLLRMSWAEVNIQGSREVHLEEETISHEIQVNSNHVKTIQLYHIPIEMQLYKYTFLFKKAHILKYDIVFVICNIKFGSISNIS